MPSIPVFVTCLVLASCGGLLNSERPAERTFWLTPTAPAVTGDAGQGVALAVSVEAVPGLDSDLLLTLSPDSELSHFADARWPDHLPELAGSLLRRSLRASGRFSRVSSARESSQGDCELTMVVNRFYTLLDQAGAASSVQVSMSGEFNCGDESRPLNLDSTRRVAGNRLVDVVAAHQRALDSLTRDLLSALNKETPDE